MTSETESPILMTNDRRNAYALAALRIAVGCLFLIFGQYKVFGRGFVFGGFDGWISLFIDRGAYPFMVPVLRDFVRPHAVPISLLVAGGELAIGIALVSGICVRIASGFGALYMLTLLFSSNYPGAHRPLWEYFGASLDHSVLAICFMVLVFGSSAEVLSVRGVLNQYLPGHRSRG